MNKDKALLVSGAVMVKFLSPKEGDLQNLTKNIEHLVTASAQSGLHLGLSLSVLRPETAAKLREAYEALISADMQGFCDDIAATIEALEDDDRQH